ncbi:hypothetical protein NST33_18345 [Paenibacillus sp. FSL L8-0435]|uniref:hypothetical protein n=1 Tax=Paenibacillus sp. FSL L8-0435 TaxID=2954618 RepID=UPI0030DBB64F
MNDVEVHDRNSVINDCYVDTYNRVPSEDTIKNIHEQLPSDIKHLAAEWGWFDTEVSEKVLVWIRNKKSI